MAAALSGGTTAGRGRRGRGRIAPKPQGDTGFSGPVNPRGRGMMNPPGQSAPRPGRGRGRQGVAGGSPRQGVGGAALPGPGGRQLAARVASGAITQTQADRTMHQRQTLEKALGSDWRSKLTVNGKSFAQVRSGLAKSPGNAKLAAINKKLLARRSAVLEQARSKGGKDGKSGS